jgi:hypothetical protein
MKFALIAGLFAVLAQADSLMPEVNSHCGLSTLVSNSVKVGGCSVQRIFHDFRKLECAGTDQNGQPYNIESCLCKHKGEASPIIKAAFDTCSNQASTYRKPFQRIGGN